MSVICLLFLGASLLPFSALMMDFFAKKVNGYTLIFSQKQSHHRFGQDPKYPPEENYSYYLINKSRVLFKITRICKLKIEIFLFKITTKTQRNSIYEFA